MATITPKFSIKDINNINNLYIKGENGICYEDYFESPAELLVYYYLSQLSEEYKVLYSYDFYIENNFQHKEGQCDFLIYKENAGFLFLEVKGTENSISKALTKGRKQCKNALNDLKKKQIDILGCCVYGIDSIIIFPFSESKNVKNINDNDVYFKETIEKWEKDGVTKFFNDKFINIKMLKEYNDIDSIRKVLSMFDSEEPDKSILMKKDKEKISKLTEYKKMIFDMINENIFNIILFNGKAGTGKTFLAMEKAIDLLNSEKTYNIYFSVGNQKQLSNIYNYIRKRTNLEQQNKNKYEFFDKSTLNSITLIRRGNDTKKDFDYIGSKFNAYIIDEIQDDDFGSIKELVENAISNKCKLFLFGDNNQYINNKQDVDNNYIPLYNNFINENINNKNILSLTLTQNCRNNENIKNFSYALIDEAYKNSILDNVKFIIAKHPDYNNILESYKEHIKKNSFSQCCIVYLDGTFKNEKIYDSTVFNVDEKNIDMNKYSLNIVRGTEYDSVCITKASINNINRHDIYENRKLSIACSRAVHDIYVVFEANNDAEIKQIEEILINDYLVDESCIEKIYDSN